MCRILWWIRKFFRISFISDDAIIIIEFWKLYIEVFLVFRNHCLHKHIATPCIILTKKKYKTVHYELFINRIFYEVLITYDKSFIIKDTYDD